MRYRIDFTLLKKSEISIFRQHLLNDGDEDLKISVTNLTKNELLRGVKSILESPDAYRDKLAINSRGIVDFSIYDTPKKLAAIRNVTFSNKINAKDYMFNFLDTSIEDKNHLSYFDPSIDVSVYLAAKGNPNNRYPKTVPKTVPEVVMEEFDVDTEQPEEVSILEAIEKPIEKIEETIKEVKISDKIQESIAENAKEEKEKFVCEECGKEYATMKSLKNHIRKTHKS